MSERKCTAPICLAKRNEMPSIYSGGNFFKEDWVEKPTEPQPDQAPPQQATVFSSQEKVTHQPNTSGAVQRRNPN